MLDSTNPPKALCNRWIFPYMKMWNFLTLLMKHHYLSEYWSIFQAPARNFWFDFQPLRDILEFLPPPSPPFYHPHTAAFKKTNPKRIFVSDEIFHKGTFNWSRWPCYFYFLLSFLPLQLTASQPSDPWWKQWSPQIRRFPQNFEKIGPTARF